MLKKLMQFLSKNKDSDNKKDNSSDVSQSLASNKKVAHTAEELKNAGDQSFMANNLAQAELYYRQSLEINPNQPDAYSNLGTVLGNLNRFDEALASYDSAIALKPDYAEAYYNRGVVLDDAKRFDEAVTSYDRAIALKPDYVDAYYNRGVILNSLNRYDEALASYDGAIALRSDYAEAYNNRGIVLDGLKRLNEALASYDRAVALKADYVEVYNNRGVILNRLSRFDEALASYDRAIALKPDYAEAYNNRGIVFANLNRFDEAQTSYYQATTLKPDYAEAYYNRGVTLNSLKRLDEALKNYDRAIALKPHYAEAYYNRGVILNDLNRFGEALASYDGAIALRPDYAEAYNNRGNVLDGLKRLNEALASYDRAVALKADYVEAYYNRGVILNGLKRLDEALKSYSHALALKPDYELLYGHWLHTKMMLCDWTNYDNQVAQLAEKIGHNENASPPFAVLARLNSRALQKKAAEIHVRSECPVDDALPEISKYPKRDKIRIGYFSADLHNHATTYLMAELFESHDKSKVELFAFSFGPDTKDQMRKRITAAFDQFIDVRLQSDQEVAMLARSFEIDIAVDLKGFTQDGRPGIFALRAAPVQINYLGYPGTMGAEYIDYLVADTTLIPKSHQHDYSEKIVYLPDSYQINDTKRIIADRVFKREELELPPTGFVFCCFNYSYKITPSTFDSWMRILQQVEASVLWLLEDSATASANLRKEAALRGVDGKRLIFAKRLPLPEHLARHRLADLFLDTLPCNAHTTTSDALWAGLPVLTCLGEAFAGRVAASLLNAVHLPELIVSTQNEYETLAVSLATQPDKLMHIKQKLADNRLTTPLFDTQQFTQYIESAYINIYERHQAGLKPDHISVNALEMSSNIS